MHRINTDERAQQAAGKDGATKPSHENDVLKWMQTPDGMAVRDVVNAVLTPGLMELLHMAYLRGYSSGYEEATNFAIEKLNRGPRR